MDYVIPIAFGLFAALSISYGVYSLVRAWQSTHWPRTMGTIATSEVEQYRDSKQTLMYRPSVSYRYSVSGKEHVSYRLSFGGEMGTNWPEPAEKTVALYPVGTTVTVHYDPGKPSESVLKPGQYKMPLFAIGFGSLFGFLAWLIS